MNDSPNSWASNLRDPRWQKKRLEIFERDGWRCRQCGDTASNLQVHHRQYTWGRAPWDYSSEDLVTLCETCHAHATNLAKEAKELLSAILAHSSDYKVELIIGVLKSEEGQHRLAFNDGPTITLGSHHEGVGFCLLQRPSCFSGPNFHANFWVWAKNQEWPQTMKLPEWIAIFEDCAFSASREEVA